MTTYQKYNLVLTHSFPTNSILLQGLIEYLSQYFNVFFIDLPGFSKETSPLSDITIEGYVDYIEHKIADLKLDKYILGGMSFSNCIISRVTVDEKCRGIIALEPYLNKDSLRLDWWHLFFYRSLSSIISKFKLHNLIWNSYCLGIFFKFTDKRILEIIMHEIDPRTFIETLNLIFSLKSIYWAPKPYVLVANMDDHRIDYSKNIKVFKDNVSDLSVINTEMEHFPKQLSKEYFASKIPKTTIDEIMSWIKRVY